MIKWYLLKFFPIFLWIISKQLCSVNSSAVDAVRAEDEQTPWKPTVITAREVTANSTHLFAIDEKSSIKSDKIERRVDTFPIKEPQAWHPALITAEEPETAGFVVSATQRFGEADIPIIERRNDWKQIDNVGIVESPVLQVQSQFSVDQVTGSESDRPHFQPWVQRERFVASTRPTITSTQKNNKAYRRPYSVARRNEELKASQIQMHEIDNGKSANLKNILKQTGGISLSEILQEQNLSLDDLLKGKQNAIRALQNTAAPPNESAETGKTTRRLPSMSQLNIFKPRRNFYNGTTRSPNHFKSDINIEPTQRNLDDTSNEMISSERKIVSTIPTYFADTSSTSHETNGSRRLPVSRGKPIKEVVSAIRPDLNNSNLRKRLPSMKLLHLKQQQSHVSSTVDTEPQISINDTIENVPETISNVDVMEENENSAVLSSTAETIISSTSTENSSRLSLRERLSLRPPRLRNPNFNQFTANISDVTSAQPSPHTEFTSTKATTISEETLPYTIIPFPSQLDEQHFSQLNETVYDNMQPIDDLNKKLNESAPEFNLVDLEDESKSKEVASLEDLFNADGIDSESGSNSNSGESEDEFVHASSTSRSDSIFKSDKPNSLKIFGGNLVSIFRKTLDKLDVTERNPALFTDVSSKMVDDKTELMELLNDRRSGARLVKVLRQRNMTVDELIEHRKRGSSQLHLAEIFYNRTKARLEASTSTSQPPSSTGKLNVVAAFKNFPNFELDNVKSVSPDEIKTDSQGSSYFTSIINVQPTAEVMKEGRAIRKPFVIKLAESATKQNIPTQQWQTDHSDTSQRNVEQNFLENSSQGSAVFASRQGLRPSTGDDSTANAFHDIIDQNRNDAAARSHDPLDLELSGHGYKRNSVLIENAQMPIGVRSAIVASASIVLISLTIFLIIFLVCRWRQKRKRKICYSDRFQALRGRLPILTSSTSKRSSSPPIQHYCAAPNSSRRSSKLNTMDPNSPEVQEYLHDAMNKKYSVRN